MYRSSPCTVHGLSIERFSAIIRPLLFLLGHVLIQGTPRYTLSEETKPLEPGSYFGATGPAAHPLSSAPEAETILYVRTNGTYDIKPAE